MKLRSLDKDSQVITFGQALLLVNTYTDKQKSSVKNRVDLFDNKKSRFFSIEGGLKEIEALNIFIRIIGPIITIEMFDSIPVTFVELRNRSVSLEACRQGIVHLLQNIYSVTIPELWESDARAFNDWLKKFELK